MRRITRWSAVTAIAFGSVLVATPASATFPGTNGRIAFQGLFHPRGEIYAIRSTGTGFRQLTEPLMDQNGNAYAPDWSPDGSRIVYSVDGQGIWTVNGDGTGLTQVSTLGGWATFTPDGTHLVYACDHADCPPTNGLFLMEADGSDAPGVRLTTTPFTGGGDVNSEGGGDVNPAVSPDGTTVTFVRQKEEGSFQALFAVDIDGTNPRRLVPYRLNVLNKHDWSPDGRRLVFTGIVDDRVNVYTVAPDGSHRERLTNAREGWVAVAGSYSPDGRWIAFRYANAERGVYRLVKMRPDGSRRRKITTAPFAERSIDWGVRATS
jgi:Tol biopolymer transport system component